MDEIKLGAGVEEASGREAGGGGEGARKEGTV